MEKLIFVVFILFAPVSIAATVEEVHVESLRGLEPRTYRGFCAAVEEGFVVQREVYGFKNHGSVGIGIARNVSHAVQAACAEENVQGPDV